MGNLKLDTLKSLTSHITSWTNHRTDATIDFIGLRNGSILFIRDGGNSLTIKRILNDKFIKYTNGVREETLSLHSDDSEYNNAFYQHFLYNTPEKSVPKSKTMMSFLKQLEKEPKIIKILNRLYISVIGAESYVELTLNNSTFSLEILEDGGNPHYEIRTPIGQVKLHDDLCVDTFTHYLKQVMQLGFD